MNPAYAEFFQRGTGHSPYPFQERFAEGELPSLARVPTGLGKTAMAIVGWLWRRMAADPETRRGTPRRLVYCLPMRVLVEQTRQMTIAWLQDLGLLAGRAEFDEEGGRRTLRSYAPDPQERGRVAVYAIMGGEEEEEWDIHPEGEAIIIGTQDMLLSRALNRGYAASRSRWPMHFGTLHTDCFWVFDEIQLICAGLATSAQLEAFRRLIPRADAGQETRAPSCRSLWMSATLEPKWLRTVDFERYADGLKVLGLDARDREDERVRRLWNARKPLAKASSAMGDAKALAEEVREAHRPGTRTIVVLNTVGRARELFEELSDRLGVRDGSPGLVLLHSRFRAADRERALKLVLSDPPPAGRIVVSTQVIEAGVDVSAATLFTEVAPWASLVQRFGRCNRCGEHDEMACLRYVAPPDGDVPERLCAPYSGEELKEAADRLSKIQDAGPESLPDVELRLACAHVVRRKDVIDLFDTTPDLSGNDIDIDRFVRDVHDSDVRVFWRDCGADPNEGPQPGPRREELCPVPIGEFRDFTRKRRTQVGGERRTQVWRWNFLERRWEPADAERIAPGQVFLVDAAAGGYSPEKGWSERSRERVSPLKPQDEKEGAPDATEADDLSCAQRWQTVAEHADAVRRELDAIIAALALEEDEAEALRCAARWHDRGKAHAGFLAKLKQDALDGPEARTCLAEGHAPAKAPKAAWVRGKNENEGHRPYFRHELASALSALAAQDAQIPARIRDLVAYLVAAHHGKVRLSIRSLPNEKRPDGVAGARARARRFARGLWDGDELPATHLGDGVIAPAVELSLEPMELGLCESPPFAGQPSWAERMIGLRDRIGPFRLAYLETLLRAADIRASRAASREASRAGS